MGQALTGIGLLLCLAALGAADGDGIARGKVLDHVACRGNEKQSYALYLPSSYAPDRKWPLLFCLDPMARGRVPVEIFAAAAEKYGFIVAGSNNSRNGPVDVVAEAVNSMLNDLGARFSIDETRIYSAGFSGGSRAALQLGLTGKLAGVVACGAAFGGPDLPKLIPFPIFAAAGREDFNYHELHSMSVQLARRGVSNRFAEFDGGHEWLPAPLTEQALEFFTGKLPSEPARPSKEQTRREIQFRSLAGEVAQTGDANLLPLITRLKKDASRPEDTSDRLIARQVLGWAYVRSFEDSRSLMEAKKFRQAAELLECAVVIRPDSGPSWYALARAQAAAGNKRRAREALQSAIDHGFTDNERISDLNSLLDSR